MTYTIKGKEWTGFDINWRCAELLAWELEPNVKSVEFDGNCFWVNGVSKYLVKHYCNNPTDTDAIIDKCWDELMSPHHYNLNRWQRLIKKHNCTKLVAACICYIEINEGKL
jgi:hypothetical protein